MDSALLRQIIGICVSVGIGYIGVQIDELKLATKAINVSNTQALSSLRESNAIVKEILIEHKSSLLVLRKDMDKAEARISKNTDLIRKYREDNREHERFYGTPHKDAWK